MNHPGVMLTPKLLHCAPNHHANLPLEMYSFTPPGKHLETTGADDLTLASARAIIKVWGHQHQWFPGVSQVVTM